MTTFVLTLLALLVIFLAQGLRKIPADPPHIAIVTKLGHRTGEVKEEGWRFFPFFPWLYGAILVNMTKKNFDVKPADVRTHEDNAEIIVEASVTFTPDRKRLKEYLNSGGEAGVKTILEDTMSEAIREFAGDRTRHPNTWEEATGMKRDFLAEIVAIVLGKDPISDRAAVNALITPLRQGNGGVEMPNLGIKLNRVNVTRITPANKKLAEASQEEAIEEMQRRAETKETRHRATQLRYLRMTGGLTKEQALELIMLDAGKVSKKIVEKRFGVSPEVATTLLATLEEWRKPRIQ